MSPNVNFSEALDDDAPLFVDQLAPIPEEDEEEEAAGQEEQAQQGQLEWTSYGLSNLVALFSISLAMALIHCRPSGDQQGFGERSESWIGLQLVIQFPYQNFLDNFCHCQASVVSCLGSCYSEWRIYVSHILLFMASIVPIGIAVCVVVAQRAARHV